MYNLTVLFILIPIIAFVLLFLNYLLSIYNPDIAKASPFECGFSSFSQTRNPFHLHFFLVALLFLVFDLEIALLYPYLTSSYQNQSYGFWFILLFLAILTIGFAYEIGKNALKLRK